MHDLKRPITLLVLLLVIIAAAYVWSLHPYEQGSVDTTVSSQLFTPQPPSQEVIDMLAESNGFAALVSYTNKGFEPENVVVHVGDAIRFTNNSPYELWVAAFGSSKNPIYPGISDCGGSSFDTCKVLKPGEFWEFTFEAGGEWVFQNNLDKGQTGTVHVEVQ